MLQLQNVPVMLISLSTTLACGLFFVSVSDNSFSYNKDFNTDDYRNHHCFQSNSFVLPYDSVRRESGYYRNGKIKFNRWTVYDREQQIEKKIAIEAFRKNGTRKYVRQYVVKPGYGALIAYEARYDSEGNLVLDRYYVYDSYGNLIQDEPENCNQ
jgi:hypothetical protein